MKRVSFADPIPASSTCVLLSEAGFPVDNLARWTQPGSDERTGDLRDIPAPTLSDIVARLPETLTFRVPHPIYGNVDREHSLQIRFSRGVSFGYHDVGSTVVQHHVEHRSAVEAAALLYIELRHAGRLTDESSSPELATGNTVMARAA
jgi:hypothetical protein